MNPSLVSEIYATKFKFEVSKEKNKRGYHKTGKMFFQLNIKTKEDDKMERKCVAPIRSLYVDPHSFNAIECICFSRANALSDVFNLIKSFKYIRAAGFIMTYSEGSFRYSRSKDNPYLIEEEYNNSFVYYSKQLIFKSILNNISRVKPVVGLNNVNFNKIPDRFLQSFGFNKIEDDFGMLPPLWFGNTEDIFNLDGMYNQERIRTKIESFIDILKKVVE